MESDAEDSKDREFELISKKFWRKSKKLIDKHCESNINTVAEELASSKNIAC